MKEEEEEEEEKKREQERGKGKGRCESCGVIGQCIVVGNCPQLFYNQWNTRSH